MAKKNMEKKVKKTLLKKPASSLESPAVCAPTEDSLKKHGKVHKLVEHFQKGHITAEELQSELANKDTQTLWKQFEYSRNQNDSAKQEWSEVCALKRGDQKDSKKRMLLFAWLKEKKFGTHYVNLVQSLNITKKQVKDLTWLTWEQLKKKHGEVEAKARVKAGTCLARKDPSDPRFWQFLSETESQTLTLEQAKDLQVQNHGKVKGGSGKALIDALKKGFDFADSKDLWSPDDVDLNGLGIADLEGSELKDEEEDAEDDDEESEGNGNLGLSKFLKSQGSKIKPKAVTKKPLGDKFVAKLETLTQVGDSDSTEKAMKKLAAMHSILSKQLLELKMANDKAQKASQLAESKKITVLTTQVEKFLDTIGKMVVAKPKLENIKKALVQAAATSKAAHNHLLAKSG